MKYLSQPWIPSSLAPLLEFSLAFPPLSLSRSLDLDCVGVQEIIQGRLSIQSSHFSPGGPSPAKMLLILDLAGIRCHNLENQGIIDSSLWWRYL